MKNKTWHHNEQELEAKRKHMTDSGKTADYAIAQTADEQRRNNRLYDQITRHEAGSFTKTMYC